MQAIIFARVEMRKHRKHGKICTKCPIASDDDGADMQRSFYYQDMSRAGWVSHERDPFEKFVEKIRAGLR